MASGKLLRRLIKTGTEGDVNAFHEASVEVIREEREKRHHLLANDLEKILYGRRNAARPSPILQERLPKDKERGLPLVRVREPFRRLEDIVLSDENCSLFEELLQEHHRDEVLKTHGLF
ncbi:MAG: ATP-binding protein, partial [Desulfoplanes sp.]|nr:ATP-binding protein [Desulfoplanes sp.]